MTLGDKTKSNFKDEASGWSVGCESKGSLQAHTEARTACSTLASSCAASKRLV